jgi:hypothetical protein
MLRAALVAALAVAVVPAARRIQPVLLEIRVFNGPEEVTRHTRVAVHAANDRSEPVATVAGGTGTIELTVSQGIYDVQAIHERDGQVVNIQWANRLVIMKYPDEGGRHLEVLNFRNGYGALQIRSAGGPPPDVSLHAAGDKEIATRIAGPEYVLFVVPAGSYEVRVRRGARVSRYPGIEVPRDRTRLWLAPEEK